MGTTALGGIFIIAFLISVGLAQDISDSETLDNKGISKEPEFQEDVSRRLNVSIDNETPIDVQIAKDADDVKVDVLLTAPKVNEKPYAEELNKNSELSGYEPNNSQKSRVHSEDRNFEPLFEQHIALESKNADQKEVDMKEHNVDDNSFIPRSNSYPYSPDSSNSGSNVVDSLNLRSGIPYEYNFPSTHSSAQASASVALNLNDKFNPAMYTNSFGYKPLLGISGNNAFANAVAQSSSIFGSVANAVQSSAIINDDARSRVIGSHEYIYPHHTPGGEHIIQCSKENELHHLWTTLKCFVCICLTDNGFLKPVCVSCSSCKAPSIPPQPYIPNLLPPTPQLLPTPGPLPIPDFPNPEPFNPSSVQPIFPALNNDGNVQFTTPTPSPEATCNPLPTGQPFTNPLNPCLTCICKQNINAYGKIDVRIECQDNSDCVVPADAVTVLPSLRDIPFKVPLPLCEQFPPHVIFPHPTEQCKECRCAQGLSVLGLPEQQITCLAKPDCVPSRPSLVTPPSPPVPIPVETYTNRPLPEPIIVPTPGHYPLVIPTTITENPIEPNSWPPISTSPVPPPIAAPIEGPLPGPPPHDSCRPYPPNEPFQHPWDACKICQCSEITTVGLINVEINCQTKLSCCIVSPQDVISAVPGKYNAEIALNTGENQMPIKSLYNGPSTLQPPPLISHHGSPNLYITPDLQKPFYQPSNSYPGAIANSLLDGSHATADVAARYNNLFTNGYTPSPVLGETNPMTLSYYPTYLPGSIQSANSYSSAMNDVTQSIAEAGVNYNGSPASPFGSEISSSQAHAEANANSQAIASVENTKNIGDYSSLLATQKPTSIYSQYYPVVTPIYDSNVPEKYSNYNSGVLENQAYAEAIANQNQLNAQTNAIYNSILTSANKPTGQYTPYSSGLYYPVNSQYAPMAESLGISNPTDLYNQYNSLYNGKLYATDKSQYNSYKQGTLENQAYLDGIAQPQINLMNQGQARSSALAQNSLSNPGYYGSGSYQSVKSVSSANSGDQSSAVAEAVAEDYPSYFQSGYQVKKPTSISETYPYGSQYYKSYINPQIAVYPGMSEQVLDGYKGTSLKYAGQYGAGQDDTKSVLISQKSYYPLISGYSQDLETYPKYSSLYPKVISYNMNPLQRSGYPSGSNNPDSIESSK